jgi:lactate permease
MTWTQEINPTNNIAISAIIASAPIIFIFWALIIKKMKGYMASLLTAIVAILVAIFVYGMPVGLSLLSTLHGALYGFFPICWIIIGAVFLYNVSVKSGQFEIIKSFMSSITNDRRLQALLIAFSFGSFLEGAAGMGAAFVLLQILLLLHLDLWEYRSQSHRRYRVFLRWQSHKWLAVLFLLLHLLSLSIWLS